MRASSTQAPSNAPPRRSLGERYARRPAVVVVVERAYAHVFRFVPVGGREGEPGLGLDTDLRVRNHGYLGLWHGVRKVVQPQVAGHADGGS